MPTLHEMYDEADKLKDAGKLDEAAAKFQEILQQDSKYALAHSALAVVYTRLKRHDEAISGLKVIGKLRLLRPFGSRNDINLKDTP